MLKNSRNCSYATKYAVYGVLFGCCFPVLSIVFLYGFDQTQIAPHLLGMIQQAHHNHLLYIVDTAPFFLGIVAWFAGVQYDKVLRLADHDALTGLLNHRAFLQKLEAYFQYAKRYDKQGTLIFIDLNKFKLINDAYGHSTGDAYLKFVAGRLVKELRATDIIGRWGGDEFIVLMPEIAAVPAQHVAAKLVNSFCSSEILINGHSFTPAASFGLASITKQMQDVTVLINWADVAMYSAKTSGVCSWSNAAPP
jgi:diguanylate cyclase (GGDEF)-like protein